MLLISPRRSISNANIVTVSQWFNFGYFWHYILKIYSLSCQQYVARFLEDGVLYTAVGQVVACAPVMQRAQVWSRSGQVSWVKFFRGFSSSVRQMSGSFRPPRSPNIIWPSLSSSIIIHYVHQWPEMLTCPKASNIQDGVLHLQHHF